MATLPSVPSFVTGETPSIAKLNQLAYCASFLNGIPAFGVFTGAAVVTTGTNTAAGWSKTTDRDGGWSISNPTRYTAQTAGYYQFSASASMSSNGTGRVAAWWQVTTGANNPGGAGLTQAFGYVDGSANSAGIALSTGELSPYLYLLDYCELYVLQNSGISQSLHAAMQVTLESLGP